MRYLLFFCALSVLPAQSPLERDVVRLIVVRLINEARTAPARFAEVHLRDRTGDSAEAAECYREMVRMAPVAALRIAPALMASAADHAEDTGRTGLLGHEGRNGSTLRQRVERHGKWQGSIAENIAYGTNDPLVIVLDLLIDEGVASRGHRRNLLNPALAFVGAAVRPHRSMKFTCVLDFAGMIE